LSTLILGVVQRF